MVKVVIWDNDGVLVDTEELYFKTTLGVISEIGVDLTILGMFELRGWMARRRCLMWLFL